jgi:hypothetical protein
MITEVHTITDALSIVPFETMQKEKESPLSMPVKERLEWLNHLINGFPYIHGAEFKFLISTEEGKVSGYIMAGLVASKIRYYNKVTIYRLWGESKEILDELMDAVIERAKEAKIRTISWEMDKDSPMKEWTEKLGFTEATEVFERRLK